MQKKRLDLSLAEKGLVSTRSQAESFIKLGHVRVNGQIIQKPGHLVDKNADVKLTADNLYVSRAGMKLDSVANTLGVNFKDNVVMDVGSSTGGFTDYALQHGASRIIAVDSGSEQLHPRLRADPRVEVHEKTDIRSLKKLSTKVDLVMIDVSFISLQNVLPAIKKHLNAKAEIIAMVKPQFEAGVRQKNKGIIKNDTVRRKILKDFERWVQTDFKIINKADSLIAGEKGNRERFYLLKPIY